MVSYASLMAKKLGRDFMGLLAPAIVLSLVMTAGLSSLIMSRSVLKSLLESKKRTYQQLQFADLFIPLVRIPRNALERLKQFDEVQRVECRITADGQVLLPSEKQNIQARFHSLASEGSVLNVLKIMDGRFPPHSSYTNALLSDAFASAWKIKPGDTVELLLKGRKLKLRVSGLVRSAEYVYQAGSATSIPEDRLFSVWWINERLLEEIMQMRSSCNDILMSLKRGSHWHALQKPMEKILRPFGYTQMIPRDRQISNYFIESELTQLKAMAIFVPGIFLSVTLFLLNITMARVLLTQRESIGTLYAFGLPRIQLLLNTLILGLLCLVPGAILGMFFGWWLAKEVFRIYLEFYRFAYSEFQFDTNSALLSILLCITTGLAGSAFALRGLLSNTPAALLRPNPPAHTRSTRFDSLGVLRHLSLTTRMSLRNLFRRPFQSIVTAAGLAISLALLVFARFERIAISQMIEREFELTQLQTHTFLFSTRLPNSIGNSIRYLLPPGLLETHLTLPVILEKGIASRELTLQIKRETHQLRGDAPERQRTLTHSGLSLSRSLAEALNVKPGDDVQITTREAIPKSATIRISNLNENLLGYVASLPENEFRKIWPSEASTNSALFRATLGSITPTKRLADTIPTLSGALEKNFEKKIFEKTVAENIGIFENFMIAFAILIAIGVLYNNARIQFAERQSELSLLRAVGFLEIELTFLFWSDYIILTSLSLAPGLLLGRWLVEWVMRGIETEMFRIPVDISGTTYIWACLVLFLGIFFAAILIQPHIRKIPFITVLKTKE